MKPTHVARLTSRSVLRDLIDDATATKQAIDEAHESIENANKMLDRSAAPLPAPAATREADLFGGWGDDAALQAPLPSAGSNYSYDGVDTGKGQDESPPYYSQPPAPAQDEQDEGPSYSFIQAHTAPTTDMYSGGGYTGGSHNRDVSNSGFGEVMGSGPVIQQGSTTAGTAGAPVYDSISGTPSLKEVEDFKAKSKEADDVAKEAEASRRQLVAQLEELRRLADEAESKARAATDKPVKKKGLLGRGGAVQKKDVVRMIRLWAVQLYEGTCSNERLLWSNRKNNKCSLPMHETRRMQCCWYRHK